MPTSTRKPDGTSRRALVAIAAPIALTAVAGALTLAGPASAAGTSSVLPFPTSICGTASPSASPSTSPTRSATATAQASASASDSTQANAVKSAAGSASPSPSASSSASPAAGGTATPTATPSASSSSSGGFWGWLNGVWTWIFGSQQLPKASAAPVMNAAFTKSTGTGMSGSATGAATSGVQQAVTKVGSVTKAVAHAGAVTQAATGAGAQASPSPTASCVPKSQIKRDAASSDGNVAANQPWHLSSPSMTMYSLTYNGVTTIQTANGPEQVLDFTASKVTLLSMVTFSQQGDGKVQYVDGGQGQTVTLENVHLWSTSFTADVLGLIHQTFTPQSPGLLTVLQGLTIPLPLLFTNVEADNAFLNTGTIAIPGFDGHGN